MKKIFLVMLVLVLITAPVFAADLEGNVQNNTIGTTNKIDLSIIGRILTLIIGVFGGGIVLIKTAIELIHAITNQEADPQGLRKCIIRFVISVLVIGGFFGLRSFLIPTTSTTVEQNNTTGSTAAGNVFMQVMGTNGAEVETEDWRSVFILED